MNDSVDWAGFPAPVIDTLDDLDAANRLYHLLIQVHMVAEDILPAAK